MFIGHFAVGFGAKKLAPAISLGTLFLAAQLADLIWPNLVLIGIERVDIRPGATVVTPLDFVSYPYSHSLVALAAWALALAALYALLRRVSFASGAVLAGLVLSHWVLDVISHRPDMPVTLDGPERLGLGLWNSVAATLAVELTMFAVGIALYVRSTQPIDRTGRWALWSLVAFLLLMNLGNMFGPAPPSSAAVAWADQGMWLLIAWGYWIDRHRRTA